MCAPAVNYTRQKYGAATEKLAFECDKSFGGAATKPMYDKWNHVFKHSLLYHLLFTISRIPCCLCLSVK